MGSQFLLNLLALSLSGALTGMVILLFHSYTKKHFSKAWNYYIWLVVIVRLLLPVHFEINLVGSMFSYLSNDVGQKQLEQEQTASSNANHLQGITETLSYNQTQKNAVGLDAEDNQQPESKAAIGQPAGSSGQNIKQKLLFFIGSIWLFGVLLTFLLKMNDYRNFVAYIRADARFVSDKDKQALLRTWKQKYQIQKQIDLYESPLIAGAAVIGVFRPFIVIPCGMCAQGDLEYILRHELMHIKRRDLWYKWAFQMLLCIHWFNPILHWVAREMNKDCELSCDEALMRGMDSKERRVYGNVLLNAADRKLGYRQNVFATTLFEHKEDLKERLAGIMNFKKRKKITIACSVLVFVLFIFMAAMNGARAQEISKKQEGILEAILRAAFDNFDGFRWEDGIWHTSEIDKNGDAYLAYDNDALIAGEDVSDDFFAYVYCGGKNLTCQHLALNGTNTILVIYAKEETQIEAEAAYSLTGGSFMLVAVGPDNTVTRFACDSGQSKTKITLYEGRNAIKMVGREARLSELSVSYNGLKESMYEEIYYNNNEEYAAHIMGEIAAGETVDTKRLGASLCYMESETIAACVKELCRQGREFTAEEWSYFFSYLDDTEEIEKYFLDQIKNGKTITWSEEDISRFIAYLDSDTIEQLVCMLDKEQLSFELLQVVIAYLDEDASKACVRYYLSLGNQMSFRELRSISPYFSDAFMEEIYRQNQ